ncbi:BnaCnng45040D [Brassica napus]|uniref:BnaCnng45040D protein n=1 Tax=Brassica napus TaxID=3708 RepID=A0A078JHD6_BRANA|nr:BnaCnng45040D [Brassica napus]
MSDSSLTWEHRLRIAMSRLLIFSWMKT